MSKEILQKETCKVLRERAKELNIPGRWDMTKDELIEAILGAREAETSNETVSAKDECKVDNQNGVEVEAKDEKDSANAESQVDMEQKMPYIENVEIGTILAFRLSNGKVKSAKVIKKSTKNRKLKVETSYGATYIIAYEDVVWVRTGKRWPRGIYKLLKGTVDENGNNEQN